MSVRFLTHEVGSLAKPPWLVKTVGRQAARRQRRRARPHAGASGCRCPATRSSSRCSSNGPARRRRTTSRAGRAATRSAFRSRPASTSSGTASSCARRCTPGRSRTPTGFEPRGTVRSFDNKYYSKSAVTGPVGLREPYHNAELEYLQSVAQAKLKIPITGAYTLAVWSYDEHYGSAAEQARRRLAARGGDRRPARVRARHRPQHHQAEPRGADRARGGVDPDRRAGRVHGAGRARGVRGELQRERRGARLLLLDPPLLLGLRPLLPRHRGHERLPSVLRRVRELRRARARHERRRAARATA